MKKIIIAILFGWSLLCSAQDQNSRLTYDLGISSGKSGDISYTEVDVGLNFFVQPWLAWRNAVFARFISEGDNVFGLDTSARFFFIADFAERTSFKIFGGPGLRIPSEGDLVPFAETGVVLRAGGFSIGGGVKGIFNKLVDDDLENDTQYFIILSGSGAL